MKKLHGLVATYSWYSGGGPVLWALRENLLQARLLQTVSATKKKGVAI